MNIVDLQTEAFDHAVAKGFHPEHIANGDHTDVQYMATRIALIHSEASEVLEEIRNRPIDYDNVAEELADIIIRVADLAEVAGVDLNEATERKIEFNKTRAYQHGGRTI